MVKLLSHQSVKRSYPEGNRPWAIVRLLPNAQAIIVARFRNRQDADDHKRLLHRFIPNADVHSQIICRAQKLRHIICECTIGVG